MNVKVLILCQAMKDVVRTFVVRLGGKVEQREQAIQHMTKFVLSLRDTVPKSRSLKRNLPQARISTTVSEGVCFTNCMQQLRPGRVPPQPPTRKKCRTAPDFTASITLSAMFRIGG